MCGASSEQEDMYAKQSAFYDTLTKNYNIAFGKAQEILDTLTAGLKPIFEAGPHQRGFSAEQRAAIDTTATESVARGYEHAAGTLNENLAARGGSDFIPSGGENALRAGLAGMAANERADLGLQIEQADWQTGQDLWSKAAAGLGGVAAQWDPNGFGNTATNAGNAAANTANNIAMASNSLWSAAIGAVGGIAGSAVKGLTMPTPAASGGEGFDL